MITPHAGGRRPAERLTGLGVGWRPSLAALLDDRAAAGRLGFAEVIAENTRPDALPDGVRRLRARGVPVVPHGVTLGLAGAERPDPGRLARLAALAAELDSPVVSEHVAFVRSAPAGAGPDPLHGDVLEAGHLMPPPRTRAALDVLVENVREAQDALPVPLALENIAALLGWPEDELDEADFLTELVARTGCRLVIDVANLYASALARGSDPRADLARFPLDAAAYVHVAGGTYADGLYLDTHGHAMIDPVLRLLSDLLGDLAALTGDAGLPGVMLERDTDVSAATVAPELTRLEAALADVTATAVVRRAAVGALEPTGAAVVGHD